MSSCFHEYLAECQRQRVQPCETFIRNIYDRELDCDLDTIPPECLRALASALCRVGQQQQQQQRHRVRREAHEENTDSARKCSGGGAGVGGGGNAAPKSAFGRSAVTTSSRQKATTTTARVPVGVAGTASDAQLTRIALRIGQQQQRQQQQQQQQHPYLKSAAFGGSNSRNVRSTFGKSSATAAVIPSTSIVKNYYGASTPNNNNNISNSRRARVVVGGGGGGAASSSFSGGSGVGVGGTGAGGVDPAALSALRFFLSGLRVAALFSANCLRELRLCGFPLRQMQSTQTGSVACVRGASSFSSPGVSGGASHSTLDNSCGGTSPVARLLQALPRLIHLTILDLSHSTLSADLLSLLVVHRHRHSDYRNDNINNNSGGGGGGGGQGEGVAGAVGSGVNGGGAAASALTEEKTRRLKSRSEQGTRTHAHRYRDNNNNNTTADGALGGEVWGTPVTLPALRELLLSDCGLQDGPRTARALQSLLLSSQERAAAAVWQESLRRPAGPSPSGGGGRPAVPSVGLRRLDLSHNSLGDLVLRALAAALPGDTTLEVLDFSYNAATAGGVCPFVSAAVFLSSSAAAAAASAASRGRGVSGGGGGRGLGRAGAPKRPPPSAAAPSIALKSMDFSHNNTTTTTLCDATCSGSNSRNAEGAGDVFRTGNIGGGFVCVHHSPEQLLFLRSTADTAAASSMATVPFPAYAPDGTSSKYLHKVGGGRGNHNNNTSNSEIGVDAEEGEEPSCVVTVATPRMLTGADAGREWEEMEGVAGQTTITTNTTAVGGGGGGVGGPTATMGGKASSEHRSSGATAAAAAATEKEEGKEQPSASPSLLPNNNGTHPSGLCYCYYDPQRATYVPFPTQQVQPLSPPPLSNTYAPYCCPAVTAGGATTIIVMPPGASLPPPPPPPPAAAAAAAAAVSTTDGSPAIPQTVPPTQMPGGPLPFPAPLIPSSNSESINNNNNNNSVNSVVTANKLDLILELLATTGAGAGSRRHTRRRYKNGGSSAAATTAAAADKEEEDANLGKEEDEENNRENHINAADGADGTPAEELGAECDKEEGTQAAADGERDAATATTAAEEGATHNAGGGGEDGEGGGDHDEAADDGEEEGKDDQGEEEGGQVAEGGEEAEEEEEEEEEEELDEEAAAAARLRALAQRAAANDAERLFLLALIARLEAHENSVAAALEDRSEAARRQLHDLRMDLTQRIFKVGRELSKFQQEEWPARTEGMVEAALHKLRQRQRQRRRRRGGGRRGEGESQALGEDGKTISSSSGGNGNGPLSSAGAKTGTSAGGGGVGGTASSSASRAQQQQPQQQKTNDGAGRYPSHNDADFEGDNYDEDYYYYYGDGYFDDDDDDPYAHMSRTERMQQKVAAQLATLIEAGMKRVERQLLPAGEKEDDDEEDSKNNNNNEGSGKPSHSTFGSGGPLSRAADRKSGGADGGESASKDDFLQEANARLKALGW